MCAVEISMRLAWQRITRTRHHPKVILAYSMPDEGCLFLYPSLMVLFHFKQNYMIKNNIILVLILSE